MRFATLIDYQPLTDVPYYFCSMAHPQLPDTQWGLQNGHPLQKQKPAYHWQCNEMPTVLVVRVPEAGIEPARLLRTQDFESSASTIPPLGQVASSVKRLQRYGFFGYNTYFCLV